MKKIFIIFLLLSLTIALRTVAQNDTIKKRKNHAVEFGRQILEHTDTLKYDKNYFAKNTIYFETLGIGGLYSINYDRIIYSKKRISSSVTVGFSYSDFPPLFGWLDIKNNKDIEILGWSYVLPLKINFLYGRTHFLEIGAGPIFTINNVQPKYYGSSILLDLLTLNYRFQRKQGGYFFKAGVSFIKKIAEYKGGWLINTGEGQPTINMSFGCTIMKRKKFKFSSSENSAKVQNEYHQVRKKWKNAVFLRIGTISFLDKTNLGFPALYSLDYERMLYVKNNFGLSTSAGISVSNSLAVPVNVNFLLGEKVSWESGVGMAFYTPLFNKYQFYKYFLAFSVNPLGVRYTGDNGLVVFFKAGYYFGDFRMIGGDIYYEKHKFTKPLSYGINLNFGIGYAF